MKHENLTIVAFLFLLAITPLAFAIQAESLYYSPHFSRGMLMYFIAFIVLLGVPFLNKYLKVIAFYIIAFTASRGLMRITGEQDPVRAIYSIWPGIRLGLMLTLLLVAISFFITLFIIYLRKVKILTSMDEHEIIDYFNRGRREGKSIQELEHELLVDGVKPTDIEKALAKISWWEDEKSIKKKH